MPDAGGRQREIGHPGTIDIPAQSKERRLCFQPGEEPPRDHKTTGPAPSLDAVLEVGHLPIAVDRLIAQARQQVSERPSQPGHHRILSGLRFERLQHGVKSEPGIGTSANLPDVGRDVGEAGLE